jgi:aminoglycoside 3-N-acetyltransferase
VTSNPTNSDPAVKPAPTEAIPRERLVADLRNLGVAPGDLLFVHSSLRSVGPVAGGAASVVAALEEAIGPEGLLLMPSFNLVAERRPETWNHATTPATTG